MKNSMKLVIWGIFIGGITSSVFAKPLSQHLALERAKLWMSTNLVLSQVKRTVGSMDVFASGTANYTLYTVHLKPTGYLILNSDDRLPLVLSFSADAKLDLENRPDNAFRQLLLSHIKHIETTALKSLVSSQAMTTLATKQEIMGPFLETTWDQCNPYNLQCPADPGQSEYYGRRTPVGCVPTAYAQVMNFHRWPVHGQGSHAYSDTVGMITGHHYAQLADTYEWALMKSSYDPFGSNPADSVAAVAELMYELGVAAEANYDRGGTSSVSSLLASRLGDYLYYQSNQPYQSLVELRPSLEADLRAGFPCVVSVPGHAVVADGLMVDQGLTMYHFNYGWGGNNNGWWQATSLPGGAIEQGVTGIRPRLMAFPTETSIEKHRGGGELQWILPKRRESEISHLSLYRLEQQATSWHSDASVIPAGTNTGWRVVNAGRSGPCWFAGPKGPATLILDDVFVPDNRTVLSFLKFVRLYMTQFRLDVSMDGGLSYQTLFTTASKVYDHVWSQQDVSLAAYAGQSIKLRFSIEGNGWYNGDWAGIRIDDLTMGSGDWYTWKPWGGAYTFTTEQFSQVTTVWDDCDDFSLFQKTSNTSHRDWAVTAVDDVAHCFYKSGGGYNNRQYHLTSQGTITPTSKTRLILRTKYHLAQDQFRVLVAKAGGTFHPIWTGTGRQEWGDIAIDLSAYQGQTLMVRLEYVPGSYYGEGGIWIDAVSTQEVTNLHLEGQPMHITNHQAFVQGSHTLAATITDVDGTEHGLGPSFQLIVP